METEKITQELKNDYKTTEEWLLFYWEREAQYEEDSKYILDESPAFKNTGRGSNSSWTEYKVVELSALDDAEKWLTIIKIIESMLPLKKKVFLEMRRRAAQKNKTLYSQGQRKINWIVFVQQHYAVTMNKKYGNKEEFWLSENTIKTWWKEIVSKTLFIALKRKCMF